MIPTMSNTQRDKLARDFQDHLKLCGVTDALMIKRLTRQAINMAALAWIDGIGAYIDQQIERQQKRDRELKSVTLHFQKAGHK